jgi:hypothetical protein
MLDELVAGFGTTEICKAGTTDDNSCFDVCLNEPYRVASNDLHHLLG